MAAPATADDLIALIRKSGMVEEGRLNAYLDKQKAAAALPREARKLAGALVRDGVLTLFQAEQFMLGKWRGFTIGKYKLLERIGFGGMGQVFLCEHTYMRRRVAIKVLPPAKAEEPASLGRFYREARAAGSLDHPNIVRTHDIDQDGNLHFLVMEYVDGSSLLDIVKKTGPMDVLRSTHYIAQACLGLDHAFHSGIIHRDIKPGNIIVDREGTAKLLDLGLARFHADNNDMLTLKYDEKSVLGTADYVAPEQTVNSHEVDVRADIYGMGCTFYYLLAGHPPFPEGTIAQKLLWHQSRQPTPIRLLRPEVPEGIAAVLARMLAKDPRQRYQTPAEVAADLEPWTRTPIPPPTEEEMPQLSPAARECVASLPSSVAVNRESGVLRAEMFQRSGRASSMSVPTAAANAPGAPSGSDSSAVRPPFFEPPPPSSLSASGSSSGAAGKSSRAGRRSTTMETRSMATTSDDTPVSAKPSALPPLKPVAPQAPKAARGESKENSLRTTLLIVLEALGVFGLGIMIYFLFFGRG